MLNFTAIYSKEDVGYTVEVVELPGCLSYGETLEEAQNNIKEAILGYIEIQKKLGTKIDFSKKETFISSVPVAYETV